MNVPASLADAIRTLATETHTQGAVDGLTVLRDSIFCVVTEDALLTRSEVLALVDSAIRAIMVTP